MDGNETLRWPTNLDRAGIVRRLEQVRDAARAAGLLPELVALLENLESKSSAQLGAAVVAAISLVQEKPEFDGIAEQLSMVALNLKNLR